MWFKKKSSPQSVGSVLDSVLASSGYLTVCKEQAIVEKWPLLAGEKWAAVTAAQRVENGVLYVKVSSAPWRQEIVYEKERFLSIIRTEYSCPTVKDILFL